MLIRNDAGDIIKLSKQQSIDYLKTGRLDGSAYDETVDYNTSKEQDEAIFNNATKLQEAFSSGKEKYNLITNNCVDACQDVVEGTKGRATDVSLPSDATTPKPNSYFEKLKKAAPFFNGDIKSETVPSTMDNIPAKTIQIPQEKK